MSASEHRDPQAERRLWEEACREQKQRRARFCSSSFELLPLYTQDDPDPGGLGWLEHYLEFLVQMKPFCEAGHLTIVPTRRPGRYNIDGSYVDPPLYALACKELNTEESEVRRIMREMAVDLIPWMSNENIDHYAHWCRRPLCEFYDDMDRANQIGAHYIAHNDYVMRLIDRISHDWEHLPKPWRHSPLFRTSIPSRIRLPYLENLPSKDMLSLREESLAWNRWVQSLERAFRLAHDMARDGGETDERFKQAYKEEIADTSEDLRKAVRKETAGALLKETTYQFTLAGLAVQVLEPGSFVLHLSAVVPGLLHLLTRVLFKSRSPSLLYNHYSALRSGPD